jgi:ribulose-5-phosphate 4-epimerase/fuculose-1-phosphate aldolase
MADEMNPLRVDVAMGSRVLAKRQLAHDIIGHVSARVEPGANEMWIRCRARDEEGLARTKPEAVRRIGLDGQGDQGEGYDLPLELPIHGAILAARPEVQAVVHAHPPNAVLCGVADVPLRKVYGAYESDGMLLLNDGIPVFPRARLVSTWELGVELAETLGDKNACLLRGHGIVTAGRSVGEAMLRALRLERLCSFMWQLQLAGKADSVPEIDDEDLAFFTDPARVDISRSTEWRWRAYRAEVED